MQAQSFYPFRHELCVLPTEGESQYEAFQSIIDAIMSAKIEKGGKLTPYELLCKHHEITIFQYDQFPSTPEGVNEMFRENSKTNLAICFKPDEVTHYIGLKKTDDSENVEVWNPYASVQADDSQGFCQMFAFFLLMDPTGFVQVNQSKKINPTEFNKLCSNTQVCLKKTIDILRADKAVYTRFNLDFSEIDKAAYGIKPTTICKQYLDDFLALNETDAVKYYMYDRKLRGWTPREPRPALWTSFAKKEDMPLFTKDRDGNVIMPQHITVPVSVSIEVPIMKKRTNEKNTSTRKSRRL